MPPGIHPSLRAPDQTPAFEVCPLFRRQAGGRTGRLELGRVNHVRCLVGAYGRQADHHLGEVPHFAPPLPTVVECVGRAILPRRVPPPQTTSIDDDHATLDASVIKTRLAMALGKERHESLHPLVGQPEKIAHHHPHQLSTLNHVIRAALSRSVGPYLNDMPQMCEELKEGQAQVLLGQ